MCEGREREIAKKEMALLRELVGKGQCGEKSSKD
jgi:hypothetical protein